MKIKSGDKVKIIAGKDKDHAGKVLQVWPRAGLVSVESRNLLIKHLRPRRQGEKGQRIEFPAPMSIANVMLVCPQCGRATRVGSQMLDGGKKARICKKCKQVID
ncbi:50S ribosomal protein L24 [Candidatus Falkowbacteria bacterium CG10_big_fil_rev_8_21_14_0_10_44_15]|uniref:Large ribosomal subunit protein uL24 n=1 Tax=Candidatus Falkowbacteria bacterium CG10_big_fil_rev_8_21_14_0_10_44_15 TaxID=1974569 RepID=A0A2H0UYS3_9BACT|nr:MAG: 50S ribosomal protein L24 [Candidatus Falkowbacteria bacterium CG10_big_fil_rev_8_21_14_0_10_44_15]